MKAAASKPDSCVLRLLRKVGEGSFGEVFEALWYDHKAEVLADGSNHTVVRRVAVKRVRRYKDATSREVDILSKVRGHPCCVSLLACFYTSITSGESSGQDRITMNLVFNYMPVSLRDILMQGPLSQDLAIGLLFQLFSGLKHIHSLEICHRDLKPENLLIDSRTKELKICDFGSAKMHLAEDAEEVSMTYMCARLYRAPELLFGTKSCSNKIDMWAAGCILWEMMTGKALFQGFDPLNQLVNILMVLGTPSVYDLWMLQADNWSFPIISPLPLSRILPDRPQACDLLGNLLVYNPTKRWSAAQVLAHPLFDHVLSGQIHVPVEMLAEERTT